MRNKLIASLAIVVCALPLRAQHEGHDMAGMRMDSASGNMLHVMAQAIPVVTRADPSAEGVAHTEGTVSQAAVMVRALYHSHVGVDGTLNLEGLTMPRGELSTGAEGEGFVDRRHPHTYLHELILSALGSLSGVRYSLSAGRGFAAFGTDDPMVRPFEKYPINHHLAQILERGVATAAVRAGAFIGEASSFGGDEPTGPSSLPRVSRLGDSWSLRGTWLPLEGTEMQASYARVASPEDPAGFGLGQRKTSVSARSASHDMRRYVLVEWERTRDHDPVRDADLSAYQSALAEGSVSVGESRVALRLEQTDRPEEERLGDPFRTPRPASDLSVGGITRWRAATVNVTAPGVTWRALSGFPFVEVARLDAHAVQPLAFLTPDRLYGTSTFWMLTAGFRLRAGSAHERMGRYAAALP